LYYNGYSKQHLLSGDKDMKMYKGILTALLAGLLLVGLSACEKGPAEKAGEAIDDAASDVADKAEEATEAVEEKLEN
jgi:hypothetical protein